LITGNNTICGDQIPTYKIPTQIAENNGFKLVETVKDKLAHYQQTEIMTGELSRKNGLLYLERCKMELFETTP